MASRNLCVLRHLIRVVKAWQFIIITINSCCFMTFLTRKLSNYDLTAFDVSELKTVSILLIVNSGMLERKFNEKCRCGDINVDYRT